MSKLLMVDGSAIKYQIWDTAGQEKYHSLAPMYYRGAAAAIIVYDITVRLRGGCRWRSSLAKELRLSIVSEVALKHNCSIWFINLQRASSFNTLKAWVRELQQLGPENIVIAVCGNKCDLEDKRVRMHSVVVVCLVLDATTDQISRRGGFSHQMARTVRLPTG